MAEKNRQKLMQISQKPGNNVCADCGDKDPEWTSCSIGIFLCQECAGIHRSLGTESRVRSSRLDNWDTEQLEYMDGVGNDKAKQKYEMCVPAFYRRPKKNDPNVVKKEWILGKYLRFEFTEPAQQMAYTSQRKEGNLMKLGRDRRLYQSRKFVIDRAENKLSYYVIEDSGKVKSSSSFMSPASRSSYSFHSKQSTPKPKAEINLDEVNAVFVPEKMGNPYGLQITYYKNGSTRCLYLYSENSKEIVDWYNAIRAAKLERRQIAFPDRTLEQLSEDLTRDFTLEGWLSKMGPRHEPFKRRWFTLDRRKLSYFEDPLNAFAKGEVFIGHKDAGYSVTIGAPEDQSNCGEYCFQLHVPDRDYVMRAETKDEMEQWVEALKKVVELPLTPQDTKLASILVSKKSNSIRLYRN
ncbi:arf-GAP with dual PH domain-containing protein 1 isoform X1 [Patella vulgata]|uniref:arf-GAP with dual PH domain-containing protein 1 isoform X1 n=1 Tax=Patella vulgata TaxID=6465 RepID=UPI00217FEB65|nr:arf-GAP with dual PH domain-containing protein 1 isoform X1 [Patella vulgata]